MSAPPTAEPPVAVTGAAGYLGGRVVQRLLEGGRPVRAFVRRPCAWLEHDAVDQRVGPIDAGLDLEGCRAVVHLAGPNEVRAADEPVATIAEAVGLAHAVGAAAVAAGGPRVVLLSTMHVYGARVAPGARLHEDLRCEPRHPYAIARLAAEHLLAAATDPVVLRLTNAVGAPADPGVARWTLLANDLARMGAAAGELVLRSDGLQHRDFCSIADAATAIVAATDPERVPAGTYNAGSGNPLTVRALADLVADAFEAQTGTRPPVRAPAATAPAPAPFTVDVGKLASVGITMASPLEDAIAEIVAFCLRHRP